MTSPQLSEGQAFFVTGAARSGTTPLIRVLGTGCNVTVVSEPRPRFTQAVHDARRGDPVKPTQLLLKDRWPQIQEVVGRSKIYGEKDLQVFDWLPHYRTLFNGRFVYVKRDGRDVVRSLLDYHTQVNGNFYREAPDEAPLSDGARHRLSDLPASAVLTERARPRPMPGDPWYDRWSELSRLQMTAWYWAHVSIAGLRHLQAMPPSRWRTIDTSNGIHVDQVQELFNFLEIEGFDADSVASVLDSGVNTIEAVARRSIERMPRWPQWPDAMRREFDEVAGAAMSELGFSS